jgi:hypothetical protein
MKQMRYHFESCSLFPVQSLWKDIVCGRKTVDLNGELISVTAIGGGGTADSKFGYANGQEVGAGQFCKSTWLFVLSIQQCEDVTIAPYDVQVNGVSKTGMAITAMRDGKYRRIGSVIQLFLQQVHLIFWSQMAAHSLF